MDTTENTTENSTVTLDVTAFKVAGGEQVEISTRLTYQAADPFAVAATFYTGGGQVSWVFGRALLDEGTFEPAGEGDVFVWPNLDDEAHAVVMIELVTTDGAVTMRLRTADVRRFLRRTHDAVPHGQESGLIDIDALIRALLDEEDWQ